MNAAPYTFRSPHTISTMRERENASERRAFRARVASLRLRRRARWICKIGDLRGAVPCSKYCLLQSLSWPSARRTHALERQLSAHQRVAIFGDFTDLQGLTLDALLKDVRYSASKLGELKRFSRVAVVSDTPWLRAWAKLGWTLVPQATVRTFGSTERDAALAWAAELEATPPAHGLRWIPTTRPDAYALAWNGTISDADVDSVIEQLEHSIAAHTSVRVLMRLEHMAGVRPHALFRRALWRVKALSLHKLQRYAVVGGPTWIASFFTFVQPLTGVDVRHYPLERDAEAWTWIDAAPAEPAERDAGHERLRES